MSLKVVGSWNVLEESSINVEADRFLSKDITQALTKSPTITIVSRIKRLTNSDVIHIVIGTIAPDYLVEKSFEFSQQTSYSFCKYLKLI